MCYYRVQYETEDGKVIEKKVHEKDMEATLANVRRAFRELNGNPGITAIYVYFFDEGLSRPDWRGLVDRGPDWTWDDSKALYGLQEGGVLRVSGVLRNGYFDYPSTFSPFLKRDVGQTNENCETRPVSTAKAQTSEVQPQKAEVEEQSAEVEKQKRAAATVQVAIEREFATICPGQMCKLIAKGTPDGGSCEWEILEGIGELVDDSKLATDSGMHVFAVSVPERPKIKPLEDRKFKFILPSSRLRVKVTYTHDLGEASSETEILVHGYTLSFSLTVIRQSAYARVEDDHMILGGYLDKKTWWSERDESGQLRRGGSCFRAQETNWHLL